MAKPILTGNADRVLQLERTRAGNCARCGQEPSKHTDGNCPDGGGSFTWAQTSAERTALVRNLGDFIAQAKESPRLKLTADQQALLDCIADAALNGKSPGTALTLAAALRWHVDRVATVLLELQGLELIGKGLDV